jgi:ribosomal protein S18 acetylase RimI-like enzyme
MEMPAIRTARAEELGRVLDTAALAFSTDPIMRWMFPDAASYLKSYPALMDAFCGVSVSNGTTFVSEDFSGVAMWLAPGVESDGDRVGSVLMEQLSPQQLEETGELMTQMAAYHPDDESCWYLPVIGVDACHQGRGLGSALMKHATRMLDESECLAYLESSNPLNIPLYQRHGFEIMGEIRAGSLPVMTPMIRQPQ